MSKFIPVSGPLTSTDPTVDALVNVRVGGVPGFYPPLVDGDIIDVVTPDEHSYKYRVEVRNPRPPENIPNVVYPKYSYANNIYVGNICFILAGTGGGGGSGTSGTSGTSGVGSSGSSGSSGTSPAGFSSGTSGTSGIGVPGTSGTSGVSGTSGTSGQTGSSGSSGSSGTGGGASSSGALPLGLPTDQTWANGIGGFTPTTSTADAIETLDDILALIAPAKPGNLTGQSLTLTNTTKYSAKLPTGLTAAWYSDGSVAGSTISDYVIDNTFTLTSPSPSTEFYNGQYNNPHGTLYLTKDGSNVDSITTATTGSSASLTVSSIATYNSLWSKCNANAAVIQSNEGYSAYTFNHTLAGQSNITGIRYDNTHLTPTFAVNPSVTEGSVVYKYLSGVRFYGSGTTLRISFTANNLYNKCYHTTRVAGVTMSPAAFTAQSLNPASTPAYTDQFAVSNYTLTLNQSSIASNSPVITTTLYKPDGTTVTYNNTLTRGVCTYGTLSTTVSDNFFDEAQRVVIGTLTAWDSTAALVNGNAQVKNGVLEYPSSTDYPGFTGNQEYQRNIVKASASTGSLAFGNITYTQISPYNTGSLNVLLQLDTDGQYYDLGRVVGDNNGSGSGASRANSKGARTSGSGGVVDWSFGTYSTFNNNSRYRVIIIFRDNTLTITSLLGA